VLISRRIQAISAKAASRLYLKQLKDADAGTDDLPCLYCSVISFRPVLEYACPVWHSSLTVGLSRALESLQKRAMNITLPDKGHTGGTTGSTDWAIFKRATLCVSAAIAVVVVCVLLCYFIVVVSCYRAVEPRYLRCQNEGELYAVMIPSKIGTAAAVVSWYCPTLIDNATDLKLPSYVTGLRCRYVLSR